MYPLIEIKTIPIELEMKTTNAKLKYTRGSAEMEISRGVGGLRIQSRAIKLNLDTFEARNSMTPTLARSVSDGAKAGQQAAYEATATYARKGDLLLNARIGQEVETQFAAEMQSSKIKTNVGIRFLPEAPIKINWDKGEMNIRYEMDKLNFDWRTEMGDIQFTPGNIEIAVKQQPDVIIKYVGGPLYVPRSADPNYQPIDVEA